MSDTSITVIYHGMSLAVLYLVETLSPFDWSKYLYIIEWKIFAILSEARSKKNLLTYLGPLVLMNIVYENINPVAVLKST
jgi:hypothetical protein